jgi:hypothetical protein
MFVKTLAVEPGCVTTAKPLPLAGVLGAATSTPGGISKAVTAVNGEVIVTPAL